MVAFDVPSDDEGEVEVVWVEGLCWYGGVCHLVLVSCVDCGLDVFSVNVSWMLSMTFWDSVL